MSRTSSMSDVSSCNGDDDDNNNNNINNNNNKDADKGYNLRPRKPINYRDTARGQSSEDTDDNDDSTSRGRRRPTASRRGTRARAGTGRRRPAAGSSSRGGRSRSASASRSNADLDGDDGTDIAPYLALAAMSPTETSTSKFTAADKDFYPINFSEQEVSEALKRGRCFTCPGQGPCSFSDVGGLGETIDIVRKTIRLPLLCPEFYSEFRIRPKKGLIFYGPPGVGKTMTARALVDACKSYTNQPIAFFMRKGSDILNSYVGQSEANVTKLFDAARQMSPSIIFLDEFDALGSIRTPNSHNHVESNVVSTLLALMDGLDDRGLVFVIAATNRLDAIDPAFRRPGRFDIEICFKVPDLEARKDILSKVTSSWTIYQSVLDAVASKTDNFNGADLVAVCEAAALEALERVNPTMVDCSDEDFPQELSITDIRVKLEDFEAALNNFKSSCNRLHGK